MKLSIIVPTYNSQQRIQELIKRIKEVQIKNVEKEIIVVNDCSKDKTLEELKLIKGIKYYNHTKNTGKGGAVRTGLKHATGDILYIQDDDLEYDPYEIPLIITPLLKKETKVVFGSRRLNKENLYSSALYYWGGVLLDNIFNFFLHTKISDSLTGTKAFTKEIYEKIKPIETNGFEIEAEITAKIIKLGIQPMEIPITYIPRTFKQGKNIRWHHAFPVIKALIKYSLFS